MAHIQRQADTHNPGGVTGRGGRPTPAGPAPIRSQVQVVNLRLENLTGGGLLISSPQARGWARVAHTRDELVHVINEAFREAQVAAYARWKGEAYDLDAMTPVDEAHPLTASVPVVQFGQRDARTDVHPADAWTPLPDGRWRSPGGRVYRADTDTVRRVQAKLRRNSGL